MTNADQTYTITKLQTANVLNLTVVEIDPHGNVIRIGGKNGAGKSAVLNSIRYAIDGAKAIPDKPLREGAKKGKTIVTLSDGTRVVRTYTAKGSTLEVLDPEGNKVPSPQSWLRKIVGELSFDPMEFSRRRPQEQAAILRQLVGLDTTAIDGERQAAYDKRTDIGREVKRLEAQLSGMRHDPGAPAECVSIEALGDQLEKAQQEAQRIEHERAAAERLAGDADRARDRAQLMADACKRQEADIAGLEERLTRLRAELERSRVEAEGAAKSVAAMDRDVEEARARAAALAPADTSAIRQRLREADEINARVRANAEREKVRKALAEAEKKHESAAGAIDECDERKRALLAAARFPVEGLAVDGEAVLFGGLPLAQANRATQIRVSAAIGMALNPRLRIMFVEDGSLLDTESLGLMAALAEANGSQVWMEVVSSDGDGCEVFIEDGHVVVDEAVEGAAE